MDIICTINLIIYVKTRRITRETSPRGVSSPAYKVLSNPLNYDQN